jgi:hypothetical protein
MALCLDHKFYIAMLMPDSIFKFRLTLTLSYLLTRRPYISRHICRHPMLALEFCNSFYLTARKLSVSTVHADRTPTVMAATTPATSSLLSFLLLCYIPSARKRRFSQLRLHHFSLLRDSSSSKVELRHRLTTMSMFMYTQTYASFTTNKPQRGLSTTCC